MESVAGSAKRGIFVRRPCALLSHVEIEVQIYWSHKGALVRRNIVRCSILSFRGPFGAYIIIKGGESQNAGNRVAEPGAYNTPALYRGPAAKRASRSFAGSWRATLYRAPCLQAGFAFARGRPVGERPAGVGSNRESLAPSETHTTQGRAELKGPRRVGWRS